MSLRTRRDSATVELDAPGLQAIAGALEDDIIFGRLGPRVRLVEDELMQRFGAKRHIVREALARLTTMGLVVKPPNRGASVRAFEPEDVEHIYQVREILQREAARLIPLPADPALVRELRRIHQLHSRAVAAGALRDVRRYNDDFHEALFGACGNPHLVAAIRYHSTLANAIRSYRIADPTTLAQAREEHGWMIDALVDGDRKRLVRLCWEHIIPSKLSYLRAQRLIENEE